MCSMDTVTLTLCIESDVCSVLGRFLAALTDWLQLDLSKLLKAYHLYTNQWSELVHDVYTDV